MNKIFRRLSGTHKQIAYKLIQNVTIEKKKILVYSATEAEDGKSIELEEEPNTEAQAEQVLPEEEQVQPQSEITPEATIVVTEQTPQVRQKVTRSKPPKGIIVEPKEEKAKWKTIYVVPPICPYCKMQFRAYSSLKMHYR